MISKTSFNETYDIVCHMQYELYQKIPQSFLNFIKQNMADNYEVNIDYEKGINNQELQKDTRTLLSLIYRDYLCDKEKRDILLEKDDIELRKIEREKSKIYNPDFMFENNANIIEKEEVVESINLPVVPEKESIFAKIKNWFSSFFNK